MEILREGLASQASLTVPAVNLKIFGEEISVEQVQ
jgi:hypothetical protein